MPTPLLLSFPIAFALGAVGSPIASLAIRLVAPNRAPPHEPMTEPLALIIAPAILLAIPIAPFSWLLADLGRLFENKPLSLRAAGFAYGMGVAAGWWIFHGARATAERGAPLNARRSAPRLYEAALLGQQWLRFGVGGIVVSAIIFHNSDPSQMETLLAIGILFAIPWAALFLIQLAAEWLGATPGLFAPEESPLFAEIRSIARSIAPRRAERAVRRFRLDRRLVVRCDTSALTAAAAMTLAGARRPRKEIHFNPVWIEGAIVVGVALALALEYGGYVARMLSVLLVVAGILACMLMFVITLLRQSHSKAFPDDSKASRRAYSAWRDAEPAEDRSREVFEEALRQAAWALHPDYQPEDAEPAK